MRQISICIADYAKANEFFFNLATDDITRKYIFITTSLYQYTFLKEKKLDSYLLSRFSPKAKMGTVNGSDLINTREVKLGIMSHEEAYSYALRLENIIRNISENYPECNLNLLTWNGSNVIGQVMRSLKKENSRYKTAFFEISNLKGKLFVDPEGVNAQSSLYVNNCQMLKYENTSNITEYANWKRGFIEGKKKVPIPPQAKDILRFDFSHVIDFIFSTSLGIRTFTKQSIKNKIIKKGFNKNKLIFTNVIPDRYVFFPMQVSNDTQLLLNSNTDNKSLLKQLIISEGCSIVIKPHPAEINYDYILDVAKASPDRVYISNKNTYELIEGASKVVTINSTVGFESMIFGKEVDFYGKSFYASFNEQIAANYIFDYLVDVDFFEQKEKKIEGHTIKKIYEKIS
jgi:capsular polysaccharide export protein